MSQYSTESLIAQAREGVHQELYDLGMKIDDEKPTKRDHDSARGIIYQAIEAGGADLVRVSETCSRFKTLAVLFEKELRNFEASRRRQEMAENLGGG